MDWLKSSTKLATGEPIPSGSLLHRFFHQIIKSLLASGGNHFVSSTPKADQPQILISPVHAPLSRSKLGITRKRKTVVGGTWPESYMVGGTWPEKHGRRNMAGGPWPEEHGRRTMAGETWPEKYGRRDMVGELLIIII